MPQYFKESDLVEKKFYNSALPILNTVFAQKQLFFDGAYACYLLGDVLYDSGRSPLANAIDRNIFRSSFPAIFGAFVSGGTFEAYLTVFKSIFGDNVDVEFTVPGPGKLNIDIIAAGFELSNFVSREIVDNEYEFSQVTDQAGNHLIFQTVKGLQTQYEVEQMLFEMVPAGIYTEITLSVEE